jgi:hypothetical protein
MRNYLKIFFLAVSLYGGTAFAQIPVEVFTGHERTSVDIMFFKFFRNQQGNNSRFLFFNRNRASVDYRMTETSYLPQFGFTEAISYNHEKLKGFAPVFVAQVFSGGVYPKAGIQYAFIRENITVFSWFVTETLKNPNLDFFLLFRFTPKLSEKVNLFTQIETVNTFPTLNSDNFNFSQRLRLGIQLKRFQSGFGADFSENEKDNYDINANFGLFLRYEF